MKRCLAFLAAFGLVACATSTLPPDDGVVYGAGVEAGDEGNPYGGGDDAATGSDSGEMVNDAGTAQDTSTTTDSGSVADSGATDTGSGPPPGVCAKTSLQTVEYGADILGGTGTDCTGMVSACAPGECCYPNSIIALCVTE